LWLARFVNGSCETLPPSLGIGITPAVSDNGGSSDIKKSDHLTESYPVLPRDDYV